MKRHDVLSMIGKAVLCLLEMRWMVACRARSVGPVISRRGFSTLSREERPLADDLDATATGILDRFQELPSVEEAVIDRGAREETRDSVENKNVLQQVRG